MPTTETNPGRLTDAASAATLLADSAVVALALADRSLLRFGNAAFRRLFKRNDIEGTSVLDLIDPVDRERAADILLRVGREATTCLATGIRGDGTRFEGEFHFSEVTQGDEVRLAIFAQDLSHRWGASAQLALLAYSDPLTGLANRALFLDRLRQSMLNARHSGSGFAVLALDLDGFKQVNDTHGHSAGDLVLQRIAQRFVACLRDTDTVARIGGDEFTVLATNVKKRDSYGVIASKLIDEARIPIDLGGRTVGVNASIGIAVYPEHANAVDHLLAAADHALYAAKRQGGGRFAWAVPPSLGDVVPPPLVWNIAHEIGIPEIDAQHAGLATLLNSLGRALTNAEPYEAILKELIRYTAFHFETEERFMEQCHFGSIAPHRDMHRRLLDDITSLRLDGSGMSVSLVLRFLQEWLIRHVDGADRDFAACWHDAAARSE